MCPVPMNCCFFIGGEFQSAWQPVRHYAEPRILERLLLASALVDIIGPINGAIGFIS